MHFRTSDNDAVFPLQFLNLGFLIVGDCSFPKMAEHRCVKYSEILQNNIKLCTRNQSKSCGAEANPFIPLSAADILINILVSDC